MSILKKLGAITGASALVGAGLVAVSGSLAMAAPMTASWDSAYYLPGETATGYTWVGELKGPRFERYIRIDGPDGEMCAQVRTDWVLIDIAAKRPARVLPWMIERFTPKG